MQTGSPYLSTTAIGVSHFANCDRFCPSLQTVRPSLQNGTSLQTGTVRIANPGQFGFGKLVPNISTTTHAAPVTCAQQPLRVISALSRGRGLPPAGAHVGPPSPLGIFVDAALFRGVRPRATRDSPPAAQLPARCGATPQGPSFSTWLFCALKTKLDGLYSKRPKTSPTPPMCRTH